MAENGKRSRPSSAAVRELAELSRDLVALTRRLGEFEDPEWSDGQRAAFPIVLQMLLDLSGKGELDDFAAVAAEVVGDLTDEEAEAIGSSGFPG